MFGMATRVVSMSTLVFLFPLLKKRYGDGVCLMLAVFGRGAGGFIVGLASLGGNCPHCDLFTFREFLLVLGATELLAGACKMLALSRFGRAEQSVANLESINVPVLSALLRAIVSRAVSGARQAEAMSALFVVDTFCHAVSSWLTKTM